jgi:hypothetical protein
VERRISIRTGFDGGPGLGQLSVANAVRFTAAWQHSREIRYASTSAADQLNGKSGDIVPWPMKTGGRAAEAPKPVKSRHETCSTE